MQFCIDKSIFWDNINLIFWKKSGKSIKKKKMFLRQLCDCIELTLEMSNYKNPKHNLYYTSHGGRNNNNITRSQSGGIKP